MIDFITQTLPDTVGNASVLAYALVFLGGVLTSIGPCNLSMVPVIIGYIGGQQDLSRVRSFWLSLFFTLGSSATFMLLGVIAAAVGVLAGCESAILHWVAALACFVVGLKMLGVFKVRFDFMARLQPKRVSMTGTLGALLLGFIVGFTGSQCSTSVLIPILSAVMAKGKLVYGATLLFTYGLGRGIPIILAGTFTGILTALPAMNRWTQRLQKVAGVVLILVGLYFVWTA